MFHGDDADHTEKVPVRLDAAHADRPDQERLPLGHTPLVQLLIEAANSSLNSRMNGDTSRGHISSTGEVHPAIQ
ncbi:hypothetical protein A4E84_00650 [Streptomyces qaidamensis]|uniref:Uncharacterized protein n=1 Tax=Streptomyces qaidamensis TaxID=1783515 RepID=A0A143BTL8_9ACTN|nr:hypothetical protein [Streptomyces qaidamensis]AMW08175.1 hypothetical protein A4E84_00650 [Streptomyces qaidamensis]